MNSFKSEEEPLSVMRFSRIRCFVVLFFLVLWSLLIPVIYFICVFVPSYNPQRLGRVYHRVTCYILGLEVKVEGRCSQHKPSFFVTNHVSYLDIFTLGQIVPGYFVAKSEVANWPLLNRLAKLQNTVFIDRKAGKAKQQIIELRKIFEKGENLILFPEGTSTDGSEVKSFKSSLFAAAESEEFDIYIQPVSIVYAQYKGKGMNQKSRDNFAWYGEMPFGSHFLNVAGLGNVKVHISFSKPVLLSDFLNRKECAEYCESTVRQSFAKSFSSSGSSI